MEDIVIPPGESLLKYDSPVLIRTNAEKSPMRRQHLPQVNVYHPGETSFPAPPKSPTNSEESKMDTEEILNSILPPRQWSEGTQLFQQKVSTAPTTRTDVMRLEQHLDQKMLEKQARQMGICPIRRELYSQCFDELIRQVTITCAERGLLLVRVRDEIKMTIDTYEKLYESSIAFGMRKQLLAELGKTQMGIKITELETEKEDLIKQLEEQKIECDVIERREAEKRQLEANTFTEEIQFLKKTNQQLKTQLEGIITPKK